MTGKSHINSVVVCAEKPRVQTTSPELIDESPSTVITDAVERVSSIILATDPDDVMGLAGAHTCFQQIMAAAKEGGTDGAMPAILEQATTAEKIVEHLILRESPEPENALKEIRRLATRLQELLRGEGGKSEAPAPSAPVAKVEKPAEQPKEAHKPAHAAIEDEVALNPDDVVLAQEFISEANSHIETAEANLLKLEDAPGDLEAVNAIFRSFHTVKGVAGFLNLKQIGALAHSAENLLDLARKGKMELTGVAVDVVLESIDLLKELLGMLEVGIRDGKASDKTPKLPPLLVRLHQVAEGGSSTGKPADVAVAATESVDAAKGAAAAAPMFEVRATDGAHGDGSIKVSTERLDSLINMVGELVIAQSMVSQDVTAIASANQKAVRNISHLSKITRELQDLSMSMRMVPIQGVFQKMARVVRDISRKSGKEVEFVMVGAETELDRNVVDAIGDPLVHMVRNSVDHGIETPEQRLAAGKSRAGRLELRARHQGGQVIIEIVDDGKGLNTQRILKKAIENGIVRESDQLADKDIYQLIFAAGLSTAEKITDISGRGVGMDVVRKNVEALRGRIEIDTVAGQGTTFSIHLPLTLAIIDGMVVRVGSERYIIPINSIEQSLRPKPDQLSTVQRNGEMCMIRGKLLPLTRLHRLYKVTPKTEDPTQSLVVIVHDNQRRCCLLVDELLGQQQVVIKSLGETIGAIPGVSGAAILGDGSISLILDVPGLLDLAVND